MSRIIGFCNQKGGTGKTTSAINIATFMALAGKKTLLIDMDPQGNATTGLGADYKKNTTSIYEAISGKITLKESIKETAIKNLSVIPSSLNLTGAEIELINLADREYWLRNLIKNADESFDYILIDAPPSLGILTINILVAIDRVIIPIQCEYFALEGLSNIVNIIELIRNRLNNKIEICGILFTMADFRTRLTLQVISEVKRAFHDKTFNTIIPRNIRLAEAPSFGKPIYYYDAFCSGARAYYRLTEEILGEEIKGVYDGKEEGAR